MPVEQQYGWGWMHNMMGGQMLGMGLWMWMLILLALIVLVVVVYAIYQVDRGGNRFAAASTVQSPMTAPPTPKNQPALDDSPVDRDKSDQENPAAPEAPPARPSARSEPETPMEILQKRYARGEITSDEYEKMRIDLS